jgi:hypothetical protein
MKIIVSVESPRELLAREKNVCCHSMPRWFPLLFSGTIVNIHLHMAIPPRHHPPTITPSPAKILLDRLAKRPLPHSPFMLMTLLAVSAFPCSLINHRRLLKPISYHPTYLRSYRSSSARPFSSPFNYRRLIQYLPITRDKRAHQVCSLINFILWLFLSNDLGSSIFFFLSYSYSILLTSAIANVSFICCTFYSNSRIARSGFELILSIAHVLVKYSPVPRPHHRLTTVDWYL